MAAKNFKLTTQSGTIKTASTIKMAKGSKMTQISFYPPTTSTFRRYTWNQYQANKQNQGHW